MFKAIFRLVPVRGFILIVENKRAVIDMLRIHQFGEPPPHLSRGGKHLMVEDAECYSNVACITQECKLHQGRGHCCPVLSCVLSSQQRA